jgi:hypothetical protein
MNRDEYLAIADAIQCLRQEEADQEFMDRVIDALVEPLSRHYKDFDYVQYLNDTDITEREMV